MRCGRCGEENPERARFCLACGAPLDAEPVKQERKLVSVLFVDLVDFTRRSDRADPEDVRDTLRAYQSAAQERIDHLAGPWRSSSATSWWRCSVLRCCLVA